MAHFLRVAKPGSLRFVKEVTAKDEFIVRYTKMEGGRWQIAWMPKLHLKLSNVVTLPKYRVRWSNSLGWGGKFHAVETISGKRFDAFNHDVRIVH